MLRAEPGHMGQLLEISYCLRQLDRPLGCYKAICHRLIQPRFLSDIALSLVEGCVLGIVMLLILQIGQDGLVGRITHVSNLTFPPIIAANSRNLILRWKHAWPMLERRLDLLLLLDYGIQHHLLI